MSEKYAVYIVLVEDTERGYLAVSEPADSIETAAGGLDYDEAQSLLGDLKREAWLLTGTYA